MGLPEPGRPTGRNVILVVLDSARADMFSQHAPVFHEHAAKGLLFERAVAPAGWTLPSHVSMFSGVYPSEHGAIALGTRGGTGDNRRNARLICEGLAHQGDLLAVKVGQRGTRTFSSTSSPWLWHQGGLASGFDETDFFYFLAGKAPQFLKRLPKRAQQVGESVDSIRRYLKWVRTARDKGAARILDGIERFARKGGPFFVFTNLIETHEPHLAPMPVRRRDLDTLLQAASLVLQPPLVRLLRTRAHNYGTGRIPERVLRRWRKACAYEVAYIDSWIGELADRLERAGVARETTVVVTGDHGENLGEGGLVGHGLSTRQALAHVPLGAWGGGVESGVVTEPVSLVNMAATVIDLLYEVDAPNSVLRKTGRGDAVFELEPPANVSRPPKRARRNGSGWGAAFYDGSLKLRVDPFEGTHIVDLDLDPTEESSKASLKPTESQERALEQWRQRTSAAP